MKDALQTTLKFLFIFIAACTFSSCQSDIGLTDKQETRVVIDSFIQASKIDELDVLVILDTSGSMSDNYEDVGFGMESLRIDIENLTLDYQFGFITADPNRPSFAGPYDHGSTAIDIIMAPSVLGMTGLEHGFAAGYEFIRSEDGQEFSRPEADFLLFIISDEDEQSTITAQLFHDWLHEEFIDVRHDVVLVALLEDSECQNSWGGDIGLKYIELASLYNKSAIDICIDGWPVWLSESSFITQQKDHIHLSESEPIVKSIVVYIDEEEIFDWEYIEEVNLIQLDFVPDHGSLVEVGYKIYQ